MNCALDGIVTSKSTGDTVMHSRTREDSAHTWQDEEISPITIVFDWPAANETESVFTHEDNEYESKDVPLFSTITDKTWSSTTGVSFTENISVDKTTTDPFTCKTPSDDVKDKFKGYTPGADGAVTENPTLVPLPAGTVIEVGSVLCKPEYGMKMIGVEETLDKDRLNKAVPAGATETETGDKDTDTSPAISREIMNE